MHQVHSNGQWYDSERNGVSVIDRASFCRFFLIKKGWNAWTSSIWSSTPAELTLNPSFKVIF